MRTLLALFIVMSVVAPALAQDRAVPQSAGQMQLSFSPIVKRVAPGVVNIYAQQVVQGQQIPIFANPLFQQFFGGMAAMGGSHVENSLGSGVIVRNDGLVVTNAHVAKNAVKINIVLADRREFPAQIVLTDDKADLALLQITSDKKDFPALGFADSDMAEVGDLVLAIGDPFAVGQTVTSGIISGLARTGFGANGLGYYIQTDAAINPGNSGGALVNMKGEVVGINTQILSRTGGYMGIGFAVPSNLVKSVIASYESGGTLRRAWLGASVQPVTADIADSLGLDRPEGVLVQDVYKGGPAEASGLQRGDVILMLDGKPVENMETIRYILATKMIGQNIPITFIHQSKKTEAAIKVTVPSQAKTEEKLTGDNPLSGATVSDISPALREDMADRNLPDQGIIVTGISGMAQQLGVQPGDIILGVNAHKTATLAALKSALTSPATNGWRLDLLRNGQHITAMLR